MYIRLNPSLRSNRRVKRTMALALLLFAYSITALTAQTRCPLDYRSDEVATRFFVSAGIKMPVGAFLLIRKDGAVGAIRLTSIASNAQEWLGDSSYESYFQPSVSEPLSDRSAIKQSGPLSIRSPKGVHAVYLYGGGNHTAKVGPWSLRFYKPDTIELTDFSFWKGARENGFEFAPTSACVISEVDFTDKRLQWFKWIRYDNDRPPTTLPLAELPK